MNANLFRPEPLMGPAAYKTYAVVAPLSSHFRKGTCAEVGCGHYRDGWRVRVEALTSDLLHAAKTSGRRFVEQQVAEGETWLLFEAGQPCFRAAEHRVRVDRPPLYVVRDGDHRGNPRGTKARVHHTPANWLDDFATHQQAIADEIKKG
ncbi:hypothetical protein ACFYQQ_01245 [Streptomyces sp. NPDC005496]|uniref:hypothetical protein n=1 Tax=unclassified Streptomyces TaxID=2593676 RepID=UPI0033A3A79D